MKTFLRLAALSLGLAASAHALVFTFTPNPSDLGDLDHTNATTWGINWNAIPPGHVITGAKIKIDNIWDWKREDDALFIRLLDDPKKGVTHYSDNTNDNLLSDYFAGQGIALTTWSDPNGGNNGANSTDFVYTFTATQLSLLTSYITDPTAANRAVFGLSFDPDCHYYNSGVCFEITTAPASVPDASPTALLLGVAAAGLMLVSRPRRTV
ncbi:MAG: hypothetical protein V4773_11110 [Verrucomicrobiota bacterium]